MNLIELFHSNIPIRSRQKIYLILVFISLILVFYSIWQVSPVVVAVEDALGLVSYLPPCYWVGLIIILATSIFAFVDDELKKDIIFVIILIALGIFLLGIRVFIQENAMDSDSYYPISEVFNVLSSHHLDTANTPPLATYHSWPAIHFITASLLEVTGIDLIPIMKYTPLFSIICFVLLSYATGKRLGLTQNQCFLISFLAVSSWLVPFAGFYYPRLPATILFLLVFMLLSVPRRTIGEAAVVVLSFTALVLTHGLTALAVLPSTILLSMYRKEYTYTMLFIAIFGTWYIYGASLAFEAGIEAFTAAFRSIFELAGAERYQVSATLARLVSRYTDLSYAAIYGVLMIGSAIIVLKRRLNGERRKQIIAIFAWMVGVGLLVFWGHSQAVMRIYIYCLLPMACIVALCFSNRKLLISLMCLFVGLSLFANYAALAGFGQVTTSGLKGAQFFALQVKPREPYFADFNINEALYYDPNLIMIPAAYSKDIITKPDGRDVSLLDKYRYVVFNELTSNELRFTWGEDPYLAWPQTEGGHRASLIYNSGDFQIYENRLSK